MKTIEESIEIEVPVSTAYGQWTQFESFPQFMEGVERVEQGRHAAPLGRRIGGDKREWDAEITEQHATIASPGRRSVRMARTAL